VKRRCRANTRNTRRTTYVRKIVEILSGSDEILVIQSASRQKALKTASDRIPNPNFGVAMGENKKKREARQGSGKARAQGIARHNRSFQKESRSGKIDGGDKKKKEIAQWA